MYYIKKVKRELQTKFKLQFIFLCYHKTTLECLNLKPNNVIQSILKYFNVLQGISKFDI